MKDVLTYRHCTVKGSAYERGRSLGEQLLGDNELIAGIASPVPGMPKLSAAEVREKAALFEALVPGVNEEIRGFADAVGMHWGDAVIYTSHLIILGGCSHFAVLYENGGKQALCHGRNYDYDTSESPVLVTAEAAEGFRHTGFACKLFGRFDGMNERGLAVTTSSADVNHRNPMGSGFVFPLLVWAMLERCETVQEAFELIRGLPYAEYRNFIVSDRQGNAMLIEASPEGKSIRKMGPGTDVSFLCSADHFILEDRDRIRPVAHSLIRQKKMEQVLAKPLSRKDLLNLLETPYPEGLAFGYYEGGMGTLWSVVYDHPQGSQKVCFGPAAHGIWQEVPAEGKPGCTQTKVRLYNIDAPEGLWE